MAEVRDQALNHLADLRRGRHSNAPWLPAIADSVEVELLKLVDDINDHIEQLDRVKEPQNLHVATQLAFAFLFEYALDEYEIPF